LIFSKYFAYLNVIGQSKEIIYGDFMSNKDILEMAMKLKPQERFLIIEGLIKSLDEPDKTIDEIWNEEAEKRLVAYRSGKLETIPMEQIFK
jgi:putative addiction module component (TIGR02574 family)